MAGPFHLDPQQTQSGIPTSGSGKQTKVIVTNTTGLVGYIKMQAGLGTARKQPLERSLDSWSGHLARFHA